MMLNISYRIDLTHDRHLDSLLASVGNDGEYVAMVRI